MTDLDKLEAPPSEEWKGTKRQREALRQKFGGRCAYCGCELKDMHADHLEPRSLRPLGSWAKHPLVTFCDTVEAALSPHASEGKS